MTSTSSPACLACNSQSYLKYLSRIEPEKISSTSYSSRKIPEFMHHTYFSCDSCGLLFTHGVNTNDLTARYRDSLHESTLESDYAARTYAALVRRLLGKTPLSVLDVGSSDGKFLKKMKEFGAQVLVGIEPSLDAVADVQDTTIEIFRGPLEEYQDLRKFEAVCLFQTIEHIPNPAQVVMELMEYVSTNGRLIIVCHDRTSLINRLLGRRSPIFDIEHLQIFSRRSIQSLIENCDFRVDHIERFSNKYPFSYAIRLVFPSLLKLSFLRRLLNVLDFPIPFPVGNLIVVVSR
jgi:SAM-dependent methyltransferase